MQPSVDTFTMTDVAPMPMPETTVPTCRTAGLDAGEDRGRGSGAEADQGRLDGAGCRRGCRR